MKKPLLIAFVLSIINVSDCWAQDLIVTTNNDSIKCSIIRLRDSWVYYKIPKDTNKRELQIPRNEVKLFQFGYLKNPQSAVTRPGLVYNGDAQHLPRFEMTVVAGYSFRTASLDSVPTSLKPFYSTLLTGVNVNLSAGYFFNDRLGVGLCYSYSNYANSLTGYFTYNNTTNPAATPTVYYGTLSENIDIQYVAPEFLFRTKVARTNWCTFNGGIQLGYLWYVENAGGANGKHITATGNTVMVSENIGFDFKLASQLGLTIRFAYIPASLSEEQVDDGTTVKTVTFQTGQYQNLSRFDLSAGLKLYLGKVTKR